MLAIFGGGLKRADTVKEAEAEDGIQALAKVELVVYTGQFTRDERAGVDLLIVGNIKH